MKAGWKTVPLGEMLEVQSGYAFKSKQFSEIEGMPLIRIRDLKAGKGTVVNFVGDYDAQYVVENGDLLIGMDGEFRCYDWQGGRALLNQRVCKLKNFAGCLEPRFLYFGINKYLKEIEDVTAFTTVKHLSAKSIKSINFPIPPLEEQRRIVAVLDEAFEGLARSKENAEANLQNARELFDSALQSAFADSDVEWREAELATAGKLVTGSTPKKSEADNFGGYLPFIKPGDFKGDGSLEYNNEGLSKKGAAASRLIPAGSALMVCIGATIGKAGFSEQPLATNQQINAITPDGDLRGDYLYLQMLTPDFQSAVIRSAGQATLPIINKTKWGKLTVRIPVDPQHQKTIVDRLFGLRSKLDEVASRYLATLDELDDLRQSLLQKAFAGELT